MCVWFFGAKPKVVSLGLKFFKSSPLENLLEAKDLFKMMHKLTYGHFLHTGLSGSWKLPKIHWPLFFILLTSHFLQLTDGHLIYALKYPRTEMCNRLSQQQNSQRPVRRSLGADAVGCFS